ncbi:NADPH-dependent 7-cyano-7-deazaguanine reductase QueF [Moraxella osloensis]|uniref:NADPH-dependent 7-cyano-7-deazaguanine reductase n=1 Tax=Faucicola osloensis TaxID=34062 RepID=A0A378QBX3_FAUOS|nr:NADPH-dependent 7-cyano-7-deazaguanine reductase QueF [Moraxella osloensis]AME01993.1 preQ(1) synthase [Moraxella osloensis]OBX56553.1 NADPH-dependent 7-cyano-7-deazaguanine reductase QueF [Moraxella osloensis]QPT42264.1 NADPH-dependent 7-cyano-7-deazaguanine reductase QueF [Moraxella osloensis]STY97904.1 NADPH-dependent 7-cyano-7-deazaguanine reductase [Moraxella osloensis]
MKPLETHGILGQSTSYPKTYAPDMLYPIPRALGRAKLALPADALSIGMDWWQVFEMSWLNSHGISQVAMVRLAIPATSDYIVESKSLKLYFNSLNFTEFDNQQAVKAAVEKDLSACLKTDVTLEIFEVNIANSLPISAPQGDCIDNALDNSGKKIAIVSDVDSSSLTVADQGASDSQLQILHSHLLRSNCPVTNQPDWGTLEIQIDSQPIDRAGLLEYILSFRQHNGFHEQCVEQIFSDLTQAFAPKTLMVRAWYTRRGGIDINPCRVSDVSLLPSPSRLNRQ